MPTGSPPLTWEGRYAQAVAQLTTPGGPAFYVLAVAAKAAFELGKIDEAGRYARDLLNAAPQFAHDWNYGNAIHDGHMVLGRIALRQGDAEAAKEHLIQAGKTRGSPQLNSFGPNMSLAKDLLERHHPDAVIQYLELCSTFWEMEGGKLVEWAALARAGSLPDFGPNLVY